VISIDLGVNIIDPTPQPTQISDAFHRDQTPQLGREWTFTYLTCISEYTPTSGQIEGILSEAESFTSSPQLQPITLPPSRQSAVQFEDTAPALGEDRPQMFRRRNTGNLLMLSWSKRLIQSLIKQLRAN
jgi:hypothetical protein